MATKDALVRLRHIEDEILNVTAFVGEADLTSFSDSYPIRRTSEHAVLIVSEAVRSLPQHLMDSNPEVDWRAIRDVGNVLRHQYFEVDVQILWRIIRERLPDLLNVVRKMIASLEQDREGSLRAADDVDPTEPDR